MKQRKLPIILFSLVFSFLVWVSVNLGNIFKTTIEVPVRIENLRPNQALAVPLPKTVRFTIQATGWQLLNTILTPNLYYTVDLLSLSRNTVLYTSRELHDRVNLVNSIEVLAASPETVIVRLDERTTKRLPIRAEMDISFREGFGIVGDIIVTPDSITVSGARSLLSRIQEWKTATIALRDINAPYSRQVLLSDTLAFEVVRSNVPVSVKFDVQPIAERSIDDIPIEILQVPENRNVVLIPPKISIIVRSGVNNVANLSGNDFQASIDYRSILLDTSGFMKVTVIGPDHVKIVQQNPDQIQYVVRK